MTVNSHRADQRRRNRVTIPEHPTIVDVHSGDAIGQLVNLSADGLMVAGPAPIACGRVLQIRVPLIRGGRQLEIRLGAESLWCEDTNDSGMHWTGFQIIDISAEDQLILNAIVGD